LELADQAIVDAYVNAQPASTENSKRAGAKQQVQNPAKGRSVKYWFLALAIALTVTAWWLNSGANTSTAPASDNTEVIVDNSDGSRLASVDNSAAARKAGTPILQSVTASGASDSLNNAEGRGVSDAENNRAKGSAPAAAELPPLANSADIDPIAVAVGNGVLEFSFTADCWVEVRDGDNTLIFADLKRTRDTLLLRGKEPFSIVLGYAPGVSLSHNGAPVDIEADERSNAAALVVTRS
jgi:cytoskeleton protein RodZ